MEKRQKLEFDPEKYHTLSEIAIHLGISTKTLRRRIGVLIEVLKDNKRKHLYSPTELECIYEFLNIDKGQISTHEK